jgi:hypothetical protein
MDGVLSECPVKRVLSAIAIALLLAGCGSNAPPPPGTPAPAAAEAVAAPTTTRSIFPPDLDGNGTPDEASHFSVRRILLQAPVDAPIQITRGAASVDFSARQVFLPDGTVLHELEMERQLGDETTRLVAGEYVLNIVPAGISGRIVGPDIRPLTARALSDDVANARSALFPSTDGVSLLLRGALPSLSALALRCGDGRAAAMQLTMSRDGIVATVTAPLRPERIYRLDAGPTAKSPYGMPVDHIFSLRCLGAKDSRRAIRILTADTNRDGEPELLTLFADGAVTALTRTDRAAETLLPAGDDVAIDFAVGDFSGNGAADLAVLMRAEQQIRLLRLFNETRSNGARFTMQSEALAVVAATGLCAGDFDRDGRDDLAILDAFGRITIQYSSRASQELVGLAPRMLATGIHAADFNGDGKPDLLILGADGHGRLLFNGGGSFREPSGVRVGSSGANLAVVGDLDSDRCSDILFSGRRAQITVMTGANMKESRVDQRHGGEPRLAGAILCRDVNRDSRCDVIVALEDEAGVADDIALYLNSDKSTGAPDAVLPLGARLVINGLEFWHEHLLIATDGGLLMLKVNCEEMPPTVDSDVAFVRAYSPMPRIPSPMAAAIQDLNDDGRADMAAVDREGRLQVWLAAGDGEPFVLSGESVELGGAGSLQAIDFDRDNFPDLLFIPNDPQLRPRLLRNSRDGRFNEDETGLLPTPPTTLRGAPALGDFDRDGDLDVFWPSPLGRVQFNEGDGRWRELRHELEVRDERGLRLQFSGELCCADFTRDGIADIVAVMQSGENIGPQYLVLWQGVDSGDAAPFRPVVSSALPGSFFGLAPADFSGDGLLDLALGYAPENGDARLTLLRLREDLVFEVFDGAPQSKGVLLDLAMDDLDRDGDLDLISTERIGDSSHVTFWVNDGRGRFFEADRAQNSLMRALDGFAAVNLSLADFTGDGRPDLLAIDADGNVVIVRTTLP